MTDISSSTSAPDAAAPVVISIDAMGSDNGPSIVVAGMARAARALSDIAFVVHGDAKRLEKLIAKRQLQNICTIVPCSDVVGMTDKPSHVMRHGKGTSMFSALTSVREGQAKVAVSCGNTGALMALSMLRLRRLPGVNRPAIAALWPSRAPHGYNVILDVGADIRADADDLLNYAMMGAAYAREAYDLPCPRVGILNVGTEEHKGTAERQKAQQLVQDQADAGNLEYVGFIEGNDIPSNRVDVIVTDGFAGNIALKTGEGTATLISNLLKDAFAHSLLSRIGALFALTSLRRLRERIDPRRVNGGVFLGLNGTVVKSHGGADPTGVAAAISLAYRMAKSDFADGLAERLASAVAPVQDNPPDGDNNRLQE